MLELSPHRCSSVADILTDLAQAGIALLTDVSGPTDLLSLASALGVLAPHRDSRPDGVTVIEDRGATESGMVAFTRQGLAPHTDRSSIPVPPGLVLTACGYVPVAGGESLLADGKAIYDELASTSPAALEAFCTPRSALFGSADGYLGSIFTRQGDRVSIRLRTDDLVRFGPIVNTHMSTLEAAIEKHTTTMPMPAGSGYVINNLRWLHGRNDFRGRRLLYRVTANPHPLALVPGFRSVLAAPNRASR
ncbi:TauD/TfdA family dioxygenase [Pseudonocardia spinosispora]|uniref:TauD/TfdA family dioxygenase n=1 Tax=Pseudonocardia spinosispora TaxID=103441 RepID=UPI00040E69CB|nr:TauD/TfdA family dioxygenase [Pseudonocardia spinosispora]